MGDETIRYKRSQQRKRDFHAKVMHELHRPKIIDPSNNYKRVRMDVKDIESEENEQTTTGKDS